VLLAVLLLPELIAWAFGDEFSASGNAAILLLAAALARSCVAWSKVLATAVGRPGFRASVLALEATLLASTTYLLADAGIDAVAAAFLGIALLATAFWLFAVRPLTAGLGATPPAS
jgi:hypothetical protein